MIRRRPAALAMLALALTVTICGCAPTQTPGAAKPVMEKSVGKPTISIRSIAVVGDSISVGYNACDDAGPCKEAGWATGDESGVDSIAQRLRISGPGLVHNLAFPGTRMRNAGQELSRLTKPVDLVLVLSGANDVCQPSTASMTDAATFADRIKELFATVDRVTPGARVLMMSVPDVTQLAHVKGVPAPVVSKRVAASLCGSVLGTRRHASTEADRVAVRARVAQYDAAIKSACRARSGCIDDGGALTALKFGLNDVSHIDYFHPSEQGQRAIAKIAWRAIVRAR